MTIQLNIDDSKLDELVKTGVENLPPETIGELAKQAVLQVFQDPKTIKDIIFKKKETSYYGSESWSDIRPEILSILGRAFTDDEVKQFRKELLETLEANKQKLIVDVMAAIFIQRVFDDPQQMMHEMSNRLARLVENE